MRRFVLYLAVLVVLGGAFLPSPAGASLLINVFQGGSLLGQVSPYTGPLAGAANYNYYSDSGHPAYGPTPAANQGQIFFYEGSDGLNFTPIFNVDNAGGNGAVSWDLGITGSTTDPGVRFSDDAVGPELAEVGATNVFEGRWTYTDNTDGGVIGEIGGAVWTVAIDPLKYTNLSALKVFDASGSSINLNVNTTQQIKFSPVPEASTLVLFGVGILGLAGYSWRRRKQAA